MTTLPPVRLRPEIAALAAYRQGRVPPEGGFKLSSNENPFPPLPQVAERVAAATALNRYPDGAAVALRERLAARHGVDPAAIHVAAGSVSLLAQFIQAAAGPGDEVLYSWRGFEAYPGLVTVAGATSVRVPNDADGGHDIDGMIAAVTERTRVVIVCSPNNPTGAVVPAAGFDRLLAAVPGDVLVLLDEAYREFAIGSGGADGEAVVAAQREGRLRNVVVLRTFSKAWGLAALRIGYAVGDPAVLAGARSTAIPLSVTEPAQLAALVSLDHEDALLERVAAIAERRDVVWRALVDQGWPVPRPWGNFVWLPVPGDTGRAADAFHRRGLSVREFAGEGIRVSIGEQESVEDLLLAAQEVVGSRQATA
ncbi:MAG TPA: histidinol-phosphate transaminase [Amnibacterium sp.]|jgi:histidinol-phosphate aminotransferase|uniref:histidinol-phosphate transaminase n=1 Tax=Amnibacterium sp. TaxID=1872496 RepID=UPI002F93AE35